VEVGYIFKVTQMICIVVNTGVVSTSMPLLVVPLVDTDSTSMLSYSQRHYDIYISNYPNFVVRVLKSYQVPTFQF
jgi:hypothetical protein